MAEIENLSDSELRTKLSEYGHPVGPVTETTRKILIKKLKLLMNQRKSVKKHNRSLTRFSSGDEESGSENEQNGGTNSSRRISMPPPSFKPSLRKSGSRNTTTASSSEFSSVPLSSLLSSSTENSPRLSPEGPRTSRFSSTSRSFNRYSPKKSSSFTSRSPYEFDSGSDSDVNTSANRSRSTSSFRGSDLRSTYSPMSSHSRKTADVLAAQFKLPSPGSDSTKKDSRPFLSSFARRLRFGTSLSPQDIKESDVEEDSSSFLTRSFSSSPSTSRSVYHQFKSKEESQNLKWKSYFNSQTLSMSLLAIFILFFIWLAVAYFSVTNRPPRISSNSRQNYYPLCKDDNEDTNEEHCIPKTELSLAVQLYKELHVELLTRSVQSVCGPVTQDGSFIVPYMTERQVEQFLTSKSSSENVFNIAKGVNNLKILLISNKHWGITLVRADIGWSDSVLDLIPEDYLVLPSNMKSQVWFVVMQPHISWGCYLGRLFYKAALFSLSLLCACLLGYGTYIWYRKHMRTAEMECSEVLQLVDRILPYVSSCKERANSEANGSPNHSQNNESKEYVPIRHVHDTLIHPSQRQRMSRVWEKAVKFIEENESRIRTEVQQVWGEETSVWRWLGPPLSTPPQCPSQNVNQTLSQSSISSQDNHLYPDLTSLKADAGKRVWQGEAFDTCEGSINSLPCSPTQCLKIRHMFQLNKDYGSDWVVKVKDAIVEKCEGVKILHLSVDKESKEGCVYVKCATQQDAGLAYRQLHGSWFDGTLVTVKYLRLERYHERFPDSINAVVPLTPSNNLRLSMQRGS